LPSFVPGSGYHHRADHPLSISHPPRRSYDADNPSIATSLVPDSTIGGVCSIRRKTIKDWYSIPRELEVWTTSILVRCVRDKCRSSRLVYEGHRRNVNVCIGVGSCPLLHNCFLPYPLPLNVSIRATVDPTRAHIAVPYRYQPLRSLTAPAS
jgi:hypothetical protein